MSNAGGMATVQRYTDMLAGNPATILTSYESIATVTVGAGGSANITFSSIPSTYTHLQVRYTCQASAAASFVPLFNGDTTNSSDYRSHNLVGNGSSASAASYAFSDLYSVFSNTSVFTAGVIDILDYASTNKLKTTRALRGVDANGSGNVSFHSIGWNGTNGLNAINQIYIKPDTGNFTQYSHFALYGIK